jgi:hypothetical protein
MVVINSNSNSSATASPAADQQQPAIRLAQKTLATVSANGREVQVPSYDRRLVQPGIVHFGVSNFFRSHQAVYLDDLMNLAEERRDPSLLEWGVVGVSVTASGAEKGRRLADQDYLTTVSFFLKKKCFHFRFFPSDRWWNRTAVAAGPEWSAPSWTSWRPAWTRRPSLSASPTPGPGWSS